MKLRTSCCKGVALRKDILRFAPLWALYLIALVMFLPNLSDYRSYDRVAYSFLGTGIPAFGIVNIGYAFLCAQLLFGDLFNTKLCYSLHAMPFRREGWLATHLVAGLLFSLVPTMVGSLVMMSALQDYWFLSLYWLLATTIQFLFFYSLAILSALLTGNRFALLAVYAVFNFVSLLIYAAVEVVYLPSLEGVKANLGDYTRFSPVVQMFRYGYFQFTRLRIPGVSDYGDFYEQTFYQYDGLGDGWGYLAILGCLAVAITLFCFWLYRKRHLESAGDFVSFPRLKAPVCLVLTLCVTLVFAMLGVAFDALVIWLLVGLFIGFFGSLMLLERQLKVFRKKTFLHFGILFVAVCLSVVAVECDWFGIESWLPKQDKVASVTVSNYDLDGSYYLRDGYDTTLTEQEDIAQIILAHEDIMNRLHSGTVNRYRVYITYTMKSGRVVRRSYSAPQSGESYRIIRHYLYNTPNMLGFQNAAQTAMNMNYMSMGIGNIPEEYYQKVLEALQKDAQAGFVSTESKSDLILEYNGVNEEGINIYRTLFILPGASNLEALLKSPEIVMGYSDWDEFIRGVQRLAIEGSGTYREFEKADYEGLLDALRKDIQAGNIRVGEYVSNAPALCYDYRQYHQFYIPKEAEYVHAWLADHNNK